MPAFRRGWSTHEEKEFCGIKCYCIVVTQSGAAAAADAGSPEDELEEIDPSDLIDAANAATAAAKQDEVRARANRSAHGRGVTVPH